MAGYLSSDLSDPPSASPNPPNGLIASSPPADEPPSPPPRPTVLLRSEEEYTQEQHHCDCCGRRRRSETDKLDYIFTLLRTWRWTFTKLLDLFSTRRMESKYQRHWSNFESYLQSSQSAVYWPFSDIERQRLFDAQIGWDWVTGQLRQELEQVSELAVFGEFDVQNRMENIKLLENAAPGIENAAPHLSKMLRSLDHPWWAGDGHEEVELQLQPRHLLMFSIMCTSLHRKKCSNLPTSFGIYLLD